jgi:LPS export ABC transporter protein LptC
MRRGSIGLLALLLAACADTGADPMVAEYEQLAADQIMEQVEFSATADGVRAAKVVTDTAFIFEDSSSMHLRGVDLEMYDASGLQTAHLSSLQGVYDKNTQAMVATGDVVLVVLKDGRRIETDELHYDPETRRVWSDVETRMQEADGTRTTVASFTADDQFNNVQSRVVRGGRTTTDIRF